MELEGHKRSLYFEPQHKSLARIIKIDTPYNAQTSVSTLRTKYKSASPKQRLLIKRSMVVAMNRAEVGSTNPRLSSREQKEMGKVAGVYRSGLRGM